MTTMKNLFHSVSKSDIVYEKEAKNSLPQCQRDTFFLSEIINIKSLVATNKQITGDIEIKLKAQSSQSKGHQSLSPYYVPRGYEDRTLVFESRFESGNLCIAIKASESEYNCFLQNDINSQGYTQWFFFRVANTTQGSSVRFNLLNFTKSDSLFNHGMKVLVHSKKKAEHQSLGWHRDGTKIGYYSNGLRKHSNTWKTFYTLTWTYTFQHSEDVVYFAYCYPYTYSDLVDLLNGVEIHPEKREFFHRRQLCRTIAGNKCEYLTITSRNNSREISKRKGVCISARVHPGETVGSWMMHGVIDFLTSLDIPEAQLLREYFVFKIVPMLNPDGVINGNYRCSLAGCDLNRRWKSSSKVIYIYIYILGVTPNNI